MEYQYAKYADGIILRYNLKHKSGSEYGDKPCPNCGGTDRFWIANHQGRLVHHCRKECNFIDRQKALQRDGVLPVEFEAAPPQKQFSSDTPYHIRKRIDLLGNAAVCDGDTVVVEIVDIRTGELRGNQRIKPDGLKKFTPQMRKEGAGTFIGEPTDVLFVTEGWADAVIVHRATGRQALFALDASNLPKNVAILREMVRSVIVAADNDDKGIKAAKASGVPWTAPMNAGDDWWDVFNAVGLAGVKKGLARSFAPSANDDGHPIKIKSENDFIDSLEMPEPIVDGLIARGRHISLTANTGHAKTAMAAFIMIAVSEPEHVCWDRVSEGCDVLFCSGENPDDLKMRMLGHRSVNNNLQGKRRHYIEGIFDVDQSYQAIREKADTIADLGLIIIDARQAFQSVENDNDNAENLRFASACRKLTFLPSRPAVLVLCHPNKKATKDDLIPRGGSAYLNEVDANLSQWRSGEIVTLHWSGKIRGRDFDPIKFKLKNVTHPRLLDRQRRPIETVILEKMDEFSAYELQKETLKIEDKILLSVQKHPEQSIADRCFDCGLKNDKNEAQKSTMHRHLQSLSEQKFIKKVRRRWELTPAGKTEVERLQND